MDVIRDSAACPRPPNGTAVTIGVFDGVHLGHRHVIAEARRLAAELGAKSAVVTFDRHPAAVVRPDTAPGLLTDLDQRLELLASTGVDFALVVHFDEERSRESAEDFVRRELVECLRAKAVVVGADFHFGHRRRGDVNLLRAMGEQHGFEVDGLQLMASAAAGAHVVSSTAIRTALTSGDIEGANRMLGRVHEVRGVVQAGDRRGRELGFPTANVGVPEEILLPADGIYAGWYLRPDGPELPAAISLGRRPTFHDDQPYSLLEAHVLDFDGDLYGEAARVRFVARIRGEEKFDSVEALVARIEADVARTRDLLYPDPLL
ncbi:MAG TPA: bifunctional riboflavin kinase/FAD synthetase [Candidatus Limnocylindrales bacterium]